MNPDDKHCFPIPIPHPSSINSFVLVFSNTDSHQLRDARCKIGLCVFPSPHFSTFPRFPASAFPGIFLRQELTGADITSQDYISVQRLHYGWCDGRFQWRLTISDQLTTGPTNCWYNWRTDGRLDDSDPDAQLNDLGIRTYDTTRLAIYDWWCVELTVTINDVRYTDWDYGWRTDRRLDDFNLQYDWQFTIQLKTTVGGQRIADAQLTIDGGRLDDSDPELQLKNLRVKTYDTDVMGHDIQYTIYQVTSRSWRLKVWEREHGCFADCQSTTISHTISGIQVDDFPIPIEWSTVEQSRLTDGRTDELSVAWRYSNCGLSMHPITVDDYWQGAINYYNLADWMTITRYWDKTKSCRYHHPSIIKIQD